MNNATKINLQIKYKNYVHFINKINIQTKYKNDVHIIHKINLQIKHENYIQSIFTASIMQYTYVAFRS